MSGLTTTSPMPATAYTSPPAVYTVTDYFPLAPTSQGASTLSAVTIISIPSTPLQTTLGFTQDALSSPANPLTGPGFSPSPPPSPPLSSPLIYSSRPRRPCWTTRPPSAASAPPQDVPRCYSAKTPSPPPFPPPIFHLLHISHSALSTPLNFPAAGQAASWEYGPASGCGLPRPAPGRLSSAGATAGLPDSYE
jgi:hypothetical protein